MANREITIAFSDNDNVQGAFDEKGEMLGAWTLDDASWRDEYFNEFMDKLGITTIVKRATKDQRAAMNKFFGLE